jgi:hypothetical protein
MKESNRARSFPRRKHLSLSAKFLFVLICLSTALLVACAGSLQRTRFIEPNKPFNEINTANFWLRVSRDADLNFSPGRVIISVHDVKFLAEPDRANQRIADELSRLLRERLYWNLLREFERRAIITRERDLDDYAALGYRVLRLETAITSLEKGVGIARYVIGYGLGDAAVQVEGRLVDQHTNALTAEFAIRVRHNGFPSWGWNPRALSARHCWRLALDDAAQQLSKNLASTIFD